MENEHKILFAWRIMKIYSISQKIRKHTKKNSTIQQRHEAYKYKKYTQDATKAQPKMRPENDVISSETKLWNFNFSSVIITDIIYETIFLNKKKRNNNDLRILNRFTTNT
jgi:hypothetical protein